MTVRDLIATMEYKDGVAISWYYGQFTDETVFYTFEPHQWDDGSYQDALYNVPDDVLNSRVIKWTYDHDTKNLFIRL